MPDPIEAGQLIYANIEPEHSFAKKGGFQTVFLTPGWLEPEEQSELEGRLMYDAEFCERQPKYVCFPIGSDRRAVARLIPHEGQDAYGRPVMMAHVLMIREHDWCRYNLHPVQLFHHAPFFDNLKSALASGDTRQGTIPPLALQLPAAGQAILPEPPALLTGRAWAIHNSERQNRRLVLSLVAAPQEMEPVFDFYQRLCAGLPQALQRPLAFNSCCKTTGANAENRFDWFLMAMPIADSDYRVITLKGADPLPAPEEPPHPFERWVSQYPEQGSAAIEAAWPVAQWLAGQQTVSTWQQTPHAVWQAVSQANPTLLAQRVAAAVRKVLPAPLTERVLAAINPTDTAERRMQQLLKGFEPAELIDTWFQAALASGGMSLTRAEQQALTTFSLPPHWQAVCALWSGQLKETHRLMQQLDESHYTQLVTQFLRSGVPPPQLVLPGRGHAWLDACHEAHRAPALAEVLPMLLEHDRELFDQALLDELERLDDEQIRKLKPLARQLPLPPPFAVRLQQRIDQLPNFLQSLFMGRRR